jgi:predicted porin
VNEAATPFVSVQELSMKKSLIALAALASVAGVASAQSSVTLYGIIDLSARYTHNSKEHTSQLASGGLSSSRWGLRGTEVISSDLSAGFVLESGINADTGANGDSARMFNRRATVSLISKEMGEVRLGRDKTPVYTAQETFDPFNAGGTSVGTVTNLLPRAPNTNQATTSRMDNSMQYFLPSDLGGFYGQVAVAAGEGTTGNKHIAGRFGYAAGNLNVSLSRGLTYVTKVNTVDTVEEINLGASYKMGGLMFSAMYDTREFPALPTDLANGGKVRTQDLVLVGVSAPVGSSGSARASISKLSDDASAPKGASQVAVGYTYNLSKRTAAYTNVAFVSNEDKANYGATGGTGIAPVTGKNYRAIDVGVRHSF